jgi:hypothetical protein
MTCDDYQIAFEQQRAGASSAITRDELDAHVATCAACTAYVSVSEKVSSSMTTTLSQSPAPLAADAILVRVSAFRRGMTRYLIVFPLAIGLATLVRFVIQGEFSLRASLLGTAVGTAVCYGYLRLVLQRRMADLKALERSSGDGLVAGFSAELDRRIRLERQAWWVLPPILVGYHLLETESVMPYVFDVCFVAIVLPISIVRYRRLVRERALLDA